MWKQRRHAFDAKQEQKKNKHQGIHWKYSIYLKKNSEGAPGDELIMSKVGTRKNEAESPLN